MNRCASISMWTRTSSLNSSSSRRRRIVPKIRESRTRTIRLMPALQPQHPSDQAGSTLPALALASELFAPGPGDGIESRLAIILRGAPLGTNPSVLRQPQQRGIYRALVQPQQFLAELLDPPRDSIPVQRPERIERLQHHQVQ